MTFSEWKGIYGKEFQTTQTGDNHWKIRFDARCKQYPWLKLIERLLFVGGLL